jgi:predicted transcriptional regulator
MAKQNRRLAKRPQVAPSTLAYMERKLAGVEAQRSCPPSPAELAHVLASMQSPDEHVRAQAVRQVCPCHLPWDLFGQVRKAAQRLQHDPSPLVRANALHVAEDAREIAALEALREWLAEQDAGSGETRSRGVSRRQHRARTHGRRPSEASMEVVC